MRKSGIKYVAVALHANKSRPGAHCVVSGFQDAFLMVAVSFSGALDLRLR